MHAIMLQVATPRNKKRRVHGDKGETIRANRQMGTGQMSTIAGVMSKWRSPRQPWRSDCSLGANWSKWLVVLQVVICLRDCVLAIDTLGNGDLISFRAAPRPIILVRSTSFKTQNRGILTCKSDFHKMSGPEDDRFSESDKERARGSRE
jgi:hypothetical protein